MVRIVKNQKGMSSIMFAMIFTIILSLLAVGFATLVRNDSRQTIDQTLSYQAQYAAETAVNQVIAQLKANPNTPANANCGSAYNIVVNTPAQVTCVTWKSQTETLVFDNVSSEPFSSRIQPTNSETFNRIVIKWSASNTNSYISTATASELPNTLDSDNYPVIRFTYLPDSASTDVTQQYFVPSSAGNGTINFTNASGLDGDVGAASCNTSECTMTVTMANTNNNGYLAIAALGQPATRVTVQAYQDSALKTLEGAQFIIDATAVAQDVTKRVEARIPVSSQTWRPGFAVNARQICKDIRIDGTNNTGISGDNTCANRMVP